MSRFNSSPVPMLTTCIIHACDDAFFLPRLPQAISGRPSNPLRLRPYGGLLPSSSTAVGHADCHDPGRTRTGYGVRFADSPAPCLVFEFALYRRFQGGWSFSIAMSSIPLSGTDPVPCTVGLCQICLNATACRPNCRSPFPSRTLPRPLPPELLHSIRDNA